MNTASNRPFAVVTGGSSGIGFELARQFAEHGFDLLIAAEPVGLEEAAQKIRSLGGSVDAIGVDLATFDGVERLYSTIQSSGRSVEAIAINAGVGVGGDFTRDTNLEEEINMINLNVVSTVHLAKRVIPDMIARRAGRVLFTASVASTMPAPFEAVYGATKAFVLSFAEAIRNELKDSGVSVTALMPGPTDTNFFHRADMDDTRVGVGKKDDPADVAKQGFEALMAGKDKIVAGSGVTKLMGAMNEILPETVKAEQHRKLSEPGSGVPAKK